MHLSIHSKPPGFAVKILKIPDAGGNKNSFQNILQEKKMSHKKFQFLIIQFKTIPYELENIAMKEVREFSKITQFRYFLE